MYHVRLYVTLYVVWSCLFVRQSLNTRPAPTTVLTRAQRVHLCSLDRFPSRSVSCTYCTLSSLDLVYTYL